MKLVNKILHNHHLLESRPLVGFLLLNKKSGLAMNANSKLVAFVIYLLLTCSGCFGQNTTPDLMNEMVDRCEMSSPPSFSDLISETGLPNPFVLMDGTFIGNLDEWECKRQEVMSHLQYYEMGARPIGHDGL